MISPGPTVDVVLKRFEAPTKSGSSLVGVLSSSPSWHDHRSRDLSAWVEVVGRCGSYGRNGSLSRRAFGSGVAGRAVAAFDDGRIWELASVPCFISPRSHTIVGWSGMSPMCRCIFSGESLRQVSVLPNKRLKLAARLDCGMNLSSAAPQLKRDPLGRCRRDTEIAPFQARPLP